MKKIKQILKDMFTYEPNIIKNIKEYDKKEKAKQQKSEVQDKSRSKSNDQRG
jgi:hypothetical protein